MAPEQTTADPGPAGRALSKGESGFRGHLMVYVVTGIFLLTLNLLTSPGELWFYWPLFFWGWALAFHAIGTFGTQAPARTMEALRSLIPGQQSGIEMPEVEANPAPAPQRAASARRSSSAPFAATAFAALHERIEGLRAVTAQLPEGPVHDQALRICAAADRIAAAMAADRASEELVTWFDTQLLTPAASLLGSYVKLSSRGVSGAEDTLRHVEEQNLPLLESRFDALYTQLHRGEIIDLAVASEMLELEPPELPSATPSTKGRHLLHT